MKPRLINANALMEYCQNQMDKKIDCNDIARFPTYPTDEWHYVKDGDLPNVETKNYTYIRRRKRYERQFTDYRVIKCFVLCLNEKGKTTAGVGYFDCNRKCFLDEAEGKVYAWKEIELPETLCDKILENLKQNHEKYVQEEMQFNDVGIDDRFRKQQKKNGSLWTDREEE